MVSRKKNIICLAGPTAVGKTELTVKLCQQIGAEVISADAVQVYKGMNIGSAKPTLEECGGIAHHLIDIIEPTERYSAAEFVNNAQNCIDDIISRGKKVVISGGTMFYLNALKYGLNAIPKPNKNTLDELQCELKSHGLDYLYAQLKDVDPITAGNVRPSDPQRIIRALAVFRYSGYPISTFHQIERRSPDYNVIIIALMPESRSELHRRIERRFVEMLDSGFIEEVEYLKDRYQLTGDEPSMRAVGYRQVLEYVNGSTERNEMILKGVAATRQLAKRQLTWLRNGSGTIFFRLPTLDGLKSVIDCYA